MMGKKFFSIQRADKSLEVLCQRTIRMQENSVSKKGNGKLDAVGQFGWFDQSMASGKDAG